MFLNNLEFIGENQVNSTVIIVSDKGHNVIKTGTTILGIKFNGGVVLAADKRTTAGHMIVGKASQKVYSVHNNIALAWAGTVSANQMLIKYLRSELKIIELRTHRQPKVQEAASMMRNWQYSMIRRPMMIEDISSFIFGGYDSGGARLFHSNFDGTLRELDDYQVDGSGMMFALGVIEKEYKDNMTQDEAVNLAVTAIDIALQRDSGSGNGIDVVVIDQNGVRNVLTKTVDTHAR